MVESWKRTGVGVSEVVGVGVAELDMNVLSMPRARKLAPEPYGFYDDDILVRDTGSLEVSVRPVVHRAV